jgi:AcrR family transcriptional regulator
MAPDTHTRRLRQRGPKAPLSREGVVAAALQCLRDGGPAGLTMRKVAGRLETGPASLYVYVRDQRELHVLVLDSISARVPRPSAGGDCETGLVELLHAYARELWSFPGAARLALLTQPTGPAYLDLLETAMELLVGSGLSVRKAARAGDALFLLATASVAEHDARRADGPARSIPELFGEALDRSSTARPLLAAGHEALLREGGGLRLEWAVRAFLVGVAQSPEELDGAAGAPVHAPAEARRADDGGRR